MKLDNIDVGKMYGKRKRTIFDEVQFKLLEKYNSRTLVRNIDVTIIMYAFVRLMGMLLKLGQKYNVSRLEE